MFIRLLSVAAGGAIGAVTRHAISTSVLTRSGFPWATLIVNAAGCFVIGLILAGSRTLIQNPQVSALVVTGFLGALTTFSTFSLETVDLIQRQMIWPAALNILVSLVVGIVFVVAGGALARVITQTQ